MRNSKVKVSKLYAGVMAPIMERRLPDLKASSDYSGN